MSSMFRTLGTAVEYNFTNHSDLSGFLGLFIHSLDEAT